MPVDSQPNRRQFVARASLSLAALAAAQGVDASAAAGPAGAQAAAGANPTPSSTPGVPTQVPTPGAPPAFGTAPAVGPVVSPATLVEAEKLVQVTLSAHNRDEAAGNWRQAMAPLYERRVGPRRVEIPDSAVPYSSWNPMVPGAPLGPQLADFERTPAEPKPLPASDAQIAFAPVTQLSRWIETRQLTSERLTRIYLARIERYNDELKCVITPTPGLALRQARAADAEIAAGHYRGPLHGIPWGAKDLLDTANIRTTFGAEFYRDRVPADDAAVVTRLAAAGAVLVAKLSMGALALNDIWFGGQTKNPWLPEEGSSGSSAGPGAATAAGLVGFAIGSETGGSIVSPSMRCGVTGLRPTFGRVPRTGAMTLCWSLDKLGPMTRSVEDAMLVLKAIAGPDVAGAAGHPARQTPATGQGDLATGLNPVLAATLGFAPRQPVRGLRLGYVPGWMEEAPATEVDRHALRTAAKLGLELVPIHLPDWPYDSMQIILFAESAAAFEAQTLDGRVDQLAAQVPDAWPNTFRQARFLSAVDMVQADRLRRMVANEMVRVMAGVDLLLVPSLRDEMLTLTNFTGHPSLTLRAGFLEVSEERSDWAPDPQRPLRRFSPPRRVPHGVTLIGRLFDEPTIARVGLALETALAVAGENPPGFSQ